MAAAWTTEIADHCLDAAAGTKLERRETGALTKTGRKRMLFIYRSDADELLCVHRAYIDRNNSPQISTKCLELAEAELGVLCDNDAETEWIAAGLCQQKHRADGTPLPRKQKGYLRATHGDGTRCRHYGFVDDAGQRYASVKCTFQERPRR